jgi:hypothetical protein
MRRQFLTGASTPPQARPPPWTASTGPLPSVRTTPPCSLCSALHVTPLGAGIGASAHQHSYRRRALCRTTQERRRPGGHMEGEESVPLDEVGAATIRLNIAFQPIDRAPLDLDRMAMGSPRFIKPGSSDRDPMAVLAYRFGVGAV